ncbi:MAG: aldo/keto reductase [Opitutales bacterium]
MSNSQPNPHSAGVTSATEIATKLIQDTTVPSIGFGTWELEGAECRESVEHALRVGYRHIDTARAYGNEDEVGKALEAAPCQRSELFITSKIWRDDLAPDDIRRETARSLELLGLDYLDLMLIHWPNPDIPLESSIETLAALQSEGVIRHLGVSNFPVGWLKRAIACGPVFCNQVEYHATLGQRPLLEVCRAHDILLTAYSPLAHGALKEDEPLKQVAEKHGKSIMQVALRWLVEQDNVAALPRSKTPEHINANFDVFDFTLDADDHAAIERLPKDQRQIDPGFAPDWSS